MALLLQIFKIALLLEYLDSLPGPQLAGELVEEPELGHLLVRLDGRREHAPEAVSKGVGGLALAHSDLEHLDQGVVLTLAISRQK